MYNTIIFVALIATVSCHDLKIGDGNTGTKVYDARSQAAPTIWRQDQNVTITTNGSEVISKVIVTDLRPVKDGEVKLVDGGEGHKTVTLELLSPTALRGYDFQIEVYSVPEKDHVNTPAQVGHDHQRVHRNPVDQVPIVGQSKTNQDSTTELPDKIGEHINVPKEILNSSTERTNEPYIPRGVGKENVPVVSTTSADLPMVPTVPAEDKRDTRDTENEDKIVIPKPITTSNDYKKHEDQSEVVKSALNFKYNEHPRYSRDTVSQVKATETDTLNLGRYPNRPAEVFNPPVYPTSQPKENKPYTTHAPATAQIQLTRNSEDKSIEVPRFHIGTPLLPNFNDNSDSSTTEKNKKNVDKISVTMTPDITIKGHQENDGDNLRDARDTNKNSDSSSTTAAYKTVSDDPITPDPTIVKNVPEHDIVPVPGKVHYDYPSVIPLHYNPQKTDSSTMNTSTTKTNIEAKRDIMSPKPDLNKDTAKINIPKRFGEPEGSTTDKPAISREFDKNIPNKEESHGEHKLVIN